MDKNNRGNILENIARIRKQKGFSQDYLASKLGMKQSGYGMIENGDRGLQYEVLLQIAVAFEMDVVDIITYPHKFIDATSILKDTFSIDEKVTLQIELKKEKKDQVLKLVFGQNNLEIFNH
jgi:transcriptional regulator with XRE-family HTH domain